ncbi:exo-beta-N-acetylmuramidase NamZ family protein [Candidatus Marithrix sp. Canyon 246]|uniref:exo-beta-N-acetylmuramidase NamZ family protein n=1 Tax=Candidatus Marithrix sp. Canyon 246 TaxID=1827136 RepID=UPI000849ED9A|nr:DUF1343 domain-containing protein [Candidatus Marithrix sp. Canyon 246]
MKLGIDNFLENQDIQALLEGHRVALLGHSASLTSECRHSLDALMECPKINVVSAFGPQHGMRGDKQDNMIETDDYIDPKYGIPIFSLYGEVRYPTTEMMDTFDVILVDLQDIGTRIYTYVTTLFYMLEACAKNEKTIWILDRPNPAGRPIEGTILEEDWESFVGAAPLIMRHGLTFGELAKWFVDWKKLDLEFKVIAMTDYNPDTGWPAFELSWVNPSPNAASLNMTRCFPGTVLFEATTLSEGRGTTTALEVIGAPDIDFDLILNRMNSLESKWLKACIIRRCYFEPTFHKHVGKMCSGIQIHTDNPSYKHQQFQPYRLAALLLKAIRLEYPDYEIWRKFAYEYETEKLAIDLLTGGTFLREFVDDPNITPAEFDQRLRKDEQQWAKIRQAYLLY